MNGQHLFIFAFLITHVAILAIELYGITVIECNHVRLNCERNTRTAVNWKYQRHSSETGLYICIGGHLFDAYKPKFELDTADFTLTINNAAVDDSGVYSCIEDAGNGEIHSMQLTVVRLTTAVVGDIALLRCDKNNDNKVDWRYQRILIEYNPYIAINGHVVDAYNTRYQLNPVDYTLTINNATLNDSGFYSCIENSGIGDIHLVKLVVAHLKTVTEDDHVALKCGGTVQSLVNWTYGRGLTKNDAYIAVGGRLLNEFKPKIELNLFDYTLIINNVTVDDSGFYSCNDGSGETHLVKLNVVRRSSQQSTSPVNEVNWVITTLSAIVGLLAITVFGLVVFICIYVMKGRSRRQTGRSKHTDGEAQDDLTEASRNRGYNVCFMHYFSLPMEAMELLLMKNYIKLFVGCLKSGVSIPDAEQTAYHTLASVCSHWRQTLNGWPQSNTKHWVRHRLERLVTHICRPYRRRPQLVKQLDTNSNVWGVTQMNDNIFVVCELPNTIRAFGLHKEQLGDIKVEGLERPRDIVACSETRSLYVADWGPPGCVWRVLTDGRVNKFLPTTTTSPFSPKSLSVTSGRLLMTTFGDDVLLLYGSDAVELKRLSFTDMSELRHAVETSRGTFVFCHRKPQPQVVEVDCDGRIIFVYNDQQQLTEPCYLSIDSEGKIFIADSDRCHVLLLTSDLHIDRVLLDKQHNLLVMNPWRLFYVQETRQLIVGSGWLPVVKMYAVG